MINYSDVYASTYDDDSEIIDITHALNLKKFVLPLLTASLISWVISNNVLYDRPSILDCFLVLRCNLLFPTKDMIIVAALSGTIFSLLCSHA